MEWPPGTFANANDPIGICIVGQNPFGSTLENMVQGKKVGDRIFAVRRIADTQQASQCQILFIGATEWKRTRTLLDGVKGTGVLTVGETDDFTALGGIIAFRLDGPRVRIQVDLQTAEHARLRISSKLLSLAEIVEEATMKMPAYYRNLPVAQKIQLAGMVVGLTATLLGSASLLIDDQMQGRERMRRDVEVLADIFSANSTAALTFNDPYAAKELLATLHAKQHITAAFLYSADGKLFAQLPPRSGQA